MEEYEKDRVSNYAQYIKGIILLPISEIPKALVPRNMSPVISDYKTRRLTGLKNEFWGAHSYCWYLMSLLLQSQFSPMGYSTANGRESCQTGGEEDFNKILPATARIYWRKEDQSKRPQCPDVPYWPRLGLLPQHRRQSYGSDSSSIYCRTANSDYTFLICLNRDDFQAIPDVIQFRARQIIVEIEGRSTNFKILPLNTHPQRHREHSGKEIRGYTAKSTNAVPESDDLP